MSQNVASLSSTEVEKGVYSASIKERFRLNNHSDKETYHLVLDLSQTPITYRAGDCLAIYPHNDPDLVKAILKTLFASGDERVTDREGEFLPFHTLLTERANLFRAPKECGKGQHLLEALEKEPHRFTPETLSPLLPPLLPRFYSIASEMEAVGKEAHLTVALNENPPSFPTRFGTCSHYLCKRVSLRTPSIRLHHHPAKNFYLSSDSFSKPIIMIGPGTGVAPFRAFLQKRLLHRAHENWLFFGERREKHDFYYRQEWEEAVAKKALRLDTAFSRDGAQKIYVQDRLLERGKEVWQWLERGAYLYVCGDAKEMAKGVEQALCTLIEREGKCDPKAYIKNLKRAARYLRDVY